MLKIYTLPFMTLYFILNCFDGSLKLTKTKGWLFSSEGLTALNYTPALTVASRNEMDCMAQCERYPRCLSANFKFKGVTECSLFTVIALMGNEVKTISRDDTSYLRRNLAKTCDEVSFERGNGSYNLILSSDMPIQALCILDDKNEAWTVLLKRIDGSVNFYRNWKSYKHGFGSLNGEYWIGLEPVHLLTANDKYYVRFDIINGNGTVSYAEYDNFKVLSEKENYKLEFNSFVRGTAEDAFSYHKGMMFSTIDRDNDRKDEGACTAMGWNDYCTRASIFGNFKPGIQPTANILRWSPIKSYKVGLLGIEMKIKRMK